jgi:bacteriocin leader peptide (microcyclamide/patellamide family)
MRGREAGVTGGLGDLENVIFGHPVTRNRLLFTKKGLTTLSGQRKPNEATQMNNKSITPNPQQPVDRVPTGQLPSALAELSEATLVDANRVVNCCCGDVLP